MTTRPRVLVVAPTAKVSATIAHALRGIDCDIVAASDFMSARAALERRPPELLISEVRLGAYHGLHLAIVARGRRAPTRSILIGPADPVMEAEARRQQVVYLAHTDDGPMFETTGRILAHLHVPVGHQVS